MLPVVGFISRVRTYLKLKQNKTVDGQLKRIPLPSQTVGSFVSFKFCSFAAWL